MFQIELRLEFVLVRIRQHPRLYSSNMCLVEVSIELYNYAFKVASED